MHQSLSKFVAKIFKYSILFKGIPSFIGVDYRDASLIILYLVEIGTSMPKIRRIG